MTENKVIILHLVDGCEVVGRFLSENDRGIDIADAMLIRYGLNNLGNHAFYFNKYCPYDASSDAYFKKDVIVSIHREIFPFVVDHYFKAVDKMNNLNYNTIMGDVLDQDEEEEKAEELVEQFFQNLKPNKKLH